MLAASFAAAPATADDYPSKPIKFIVPSAPAGIGDILARLFQQKLAESGNTTTVVVENRAGAAGVVGTTPSPNAPPDGLHRAGRQSRHPGDAAAPAKAALRSRSRASALSFSRCGAEHTLVHPSCRRSRCRS